MVGLMGDKRSPFAMAAAVKEDEVRVRVGIMAAMTMRYWARSSRVSR